MTCAVAIFVKTPQLSPVKTRLWPVLGRRCSESLYLICAEAVASVAGHVRHQGNLTAYWAVAEPAALKSNAWLDLPRIPQGPGSLGQRMAHVHRQLRRSHHSVILVGADAPQIVPQSLQRAAHWLDSIESRLVIGRALDGGFWLFGSNVDLPDQAWTRAHYSAPDTAHQFVHAMRGHGRWCELEALRDIDTADDLAEARASLAELESPTVAQTRVRDWLGQLLARRSRGQQCGNDLIMERHALHRPLFD